MDDLKTELASLRIDRDGARRGRSVWWLLVVLLVLGAGGVIAWRSRGTFAYTEVETVSPMVTREGETAAAGTPVLTASGYVVARRKAVVSAKIQGRLSELRVEEGRDCRVSLVARR